MNHSTNLTNQDTNTLQTLLPQKLIACAADAISELTQALNKILANPLNPANLTNFLLAVIKFTTAVTLRCPVEIATKLINCINENGFSNIPGILACINAIEPEPVLRGYITSGSNKVFVCTVDPVTGELNTFQDAGGSGFNFPYGIAIDATNQRAYIANYLSSTVSVCTIDNTGQLSACQTTGSGFGAPVDIAVITLSNNPSTAFAYVVNRGKSVSKCTIAADGTLSNCQATGNDFFDPANIAFNTGNTHAYVVDPSRNKVSVCAVGSTTGALSACQDAGGSGFNFPNGIAIDAKNQRAYITNYLSSTVSVCTIDNTGQLSACQTTGSGFGAPVNIAVITLSNNPSTAFAYVLSQSNGIVTKCTIAADGTLSNCQATDFNEPLGIAFNG